MLVFGCGGLGRGFLRQLHTLTVSGIKYRLRRESGASGKTDCYGCQKKINVFVHIGGLRARSRS